MWTMSEAIELCKIIEGISPDYGFHVALTGGLLYKEGERKDCDLLLYRIRDRHDPDWTGLWNALADVGIALRHDYGWCKKAIWKCKQLDIFDPEALGEYPASAENVPDWVDIF